MSNRRNETNHQTRSIVAVFVDNENAFYGSLNNACSFPKYCRIMDEAQTYGRIAHAYAISDWTSLSRSLPWVIDAGLEPVFCSHAKTAFSPEDGGFKSSADAQMHVRIYETVINYPDVDTYVLVSGDRDFIHVVRSLKRLGKRVIVMSEKVSLASDLKSVADATHTFQDIKALIAAPNHKPQAKAIGHARSVSENKSV